MDDHRDVDLEEDDPAIGHDPAVDPEVIESDARGEEVKDRPVYPVDLIGSIYAQMGIAPTTKLPNPEGLPTTVMPGADEGIKTSGLLREIMVA